MKTIMILFMLALMTFAWYDEYKEIKVKEVVDIEEIYRLRFWFPSDLYIKPIYMIPEVHVKVAPKSFKPRH